MPNTIERFKFESQLPYLSDGAAAALEGLWRFLPPAVKGADSLAYYSNDAISTAVVTVDVGNGSRPLVVVVESRGTAGFLRLYDADTVSAAASAASEFVVPVATATGDVTAVYAGGNSWADVWTAGISAQTATTVRGGAVMTNLPRVYMLYHNV